MKSLLFITTLSISSIAFASQIEVIDHRQELPSFLKGEALTDQKGQVCRFNLDCGIGEKCIKTGYDLEGICM